MRILIATGIYPPEIGGPATYSKLLEDELPKRGVEVDVLPYRVVRRVPKIFRHVAYFIYVLRRGRNADIIYAQDPVSVGFPACAAAKILRKKFFLKIVGDYAWEQGKQRCGVEESLDEFVASEKDYGFVVGAMRFVEKKVATSAYKIVVPSKYLKRIVTAWGVESKKIHVVYNAFEQVDVENTKEELRAKYLNDSFTILSVGRLTPWKGFIVLLESMVEVRKKIFDAHLVIVGDGPQRKELEEKVSALGLGECVTFTGAVDRREVLERIVASDVFVLNTQYEGFSHLVLEVMSLGTPIVTTAVGGNVEIVENEKNGILISFNKKKEITESIVSVYEDLESAQKRALCAKKVTKQFSKENMLKEVMDILSS